MLSPTSVLLPLLWAGGLGVLGGIAPGTHPNVTSGDLLEYDDYYDPMPERAPSEGLPPWMRYDRDGHVVVTFVMHYAPQDQIFAVTNETLLVTKKNLEGANSDEMWHIHAEDKELKPFFATALGLRPCDVTVVHMAYSKEESIKKILVKESVMRAADIWEKLRKAVS